MTALTRRLLGIVLVSGIVSTHAPAITGAPEQLIPLHLACCISVLVMDSVVPSRQFFNFWSKCHS